jgi:hydroxymethylpyrimidine pyrophosphatase-like HAD family hydrolase
MVCTWSLLAVDLDVTLLTTDGTVSAASRTALEQLDAAGVEVLFATGRCRNETLAVLADVEYEGPIIVAGGAMLVDSCSGHTLDRKTIDPDIVKRIVMHFHDEGHVSLVLKDHHAAGYDYLLVGTHELHPISSWWMKFHELSYRRVDCIDDDPDPEHSLRVGGVGEAHVMKESAERIHADIGHVTRMLNWPALAPSDATGAPVHIVEVFASEVDKWKMALRHCQRNKLDAAQTVAIGDGLNDLEMLRGATIGIAMGNADPHVAAAADVMTESNANEGFSNAIHRLLHGDLAP